MTTKSPYSAQRRAVVKSLRSMRERMAFMLSTWNVGTKIYDGQMGGRVREVSEYPENSAQEWRRFAHDCEVIAAQLQDNARYARAMADVIHEHHDGLVR